MNKQRLTLLTRKEREAAVSGGALDERIPREELRARLSNEGGIKFEQDAILDRVAKLVGWCRLLIGPESHRMEPAEIVDQARMTAQVAEELVARLQHMHPDLDALASGVLYRARQETVLSVSMRLKPDLFTLIAVLQHAAAQIRSQPSKPGEKSTERKRALAQIVALLRAHSTPKMAARAAQAMAEEILCICGLPNPRARRN